jgi:hypothetical protein
MKYRGKNYSIVQGAAPFRWKWTVLLGGGIVKSGEEKTRGAAITCVVLLIDQNIKEEQERSADQRAKPYPSAFAAPY